MFEKIEGGSTVNIQGLDCNIPPVGRVFNRFTGQVEPRFIYKSSSIEKDQVWKLDKPENIKLLLRREFAKSKSIKTILILIFKSIEIKSGTEESMGIGS